MKAKKKVQEAPAAPQQIPAPPVPDLEPCEPWMTGSWGALVGMVRNPSPSEAEDICDFAFSRTQKLATAMTLITHSGLNESNWDSIGDTFELNACIMRHAFEIVSEALKRAAGKAAANG